MYWEKASGWGCETQLRGWLSPQAVSHLALCTATTVGTHRDIAPPPSSSTVRLSAVAVQRKRRRRRRRRNRGVLQKGSGQLSQQEALPHTSSLQQLSRADVRAVGVFCTSCSSLQPLLCLCRSLATGPQAGEIKACSSMSMLSLLRLPGRQG